MMVQLDGSHHDWFEGRRAKAVLMVMVDDASRKHLVRGFGVNASLQWRQMRCRDS
jgi:hypothetical protein